MEGEEMLAYYLTDPSQLEAKNGNIEILLGIIFVTPRYHCPDYVCVGNGIGIEIDEAKVRRESAKDYSGHRPWRNETWRGEDGGVREW
jgi:hypothetical protein